MPSEHVTTILKGRKEAPRSESSLYSSSNTSVQVVTKCIKCKEILYTRELVRKQKVCPYCDYHFRLNAYERIELLIDPGSFVETDADIASTDILRFVSRSEVYAEKLANEQQKTGLRSAVVTGHALVENTPLVLAVMDFRFIGGSMGMAVGEKITRAIELAREKRIPVLIASASGGARMQEGIYSLMQMGKTAAALTLLSDAEIPYISLLTDPTTGGVSASFATLGDVILTEPGCLFCFTGPRVIEQFMHTKLPREAVTAEFALEHGLLDAVIHRHKLRKEIARILHFFSQKPSDSVTGLQVRDLRTVDQEVCL